METSGRGLFRLPRELHDHIYRRVLVLPYPLHLLLFTNREIRDEAAKILYGSHEFVLVDTSRRQVILLESSLGSIGSVNAGHLGNICINFPAVGKKGSRGNGEESEEAASSMLWKEDLRGLKLIQEMCSGLTTLVTHVHDKNSRGLVVPRGAGDSTSLDDIKTALAEVEAQFKAIASPEKVVVKRYDGALKPEVGELMRSFGWVVVQGR